MELIVAVGLVSSVVQLVEFSSSLISKTVEIYRSSDEILDENNAIKLAADHLVLLKDEVEGAASSAGDIALQNLCKAVTGAASELHAALQKLKVQGSKGKWKSMRKALRSVWSKEEVQGLERRLASFREELNLHILVKIRQASTDSLPNISR